MSECFHRPGPHEDEELYQRLLYLAYCIHMDQYITDIRSMKLIEEWERFRDSDEVKMHCGDCTKTACPCPRCMMHGLEIDAENMYTFLRTMELREHRK